MDSDWNIQKIEKYLYEILVYIRISVFLTAFSLVYYAISIAFAPLPNGQTEQGDVIEEYDIEEGSDESRLPLDQFP